MAVMNAGPAKIEKQISLPLSQAVRIALRNITIRLGRALITAAGTMLGIAFLMSVFTGSLVQQAQGVHLDAAQIHKNTWLVTMSLLVVAVGITNSMLMSVTERYKEIGTMKCLGALDNFIVKLFLLESGMLGFFGSLIGALIGCLIELLMGLSALGHLAWGVLLAKMAFCVAIGTFLSILATIVPALQAAHMQAADAMRTEV